MSNFDTKNLSAQGSPANTAKTTVLIVDDNRDIAEAAKITIEAYTKFTVLCAHSGKQALSFIESHAIDVIVLDEVMPEMSGSDFFHNLRQRSIYVPVIFLTGVGDEQKRMKQLSQGAFDYLEKPIKARDLILLVNEAAKVMTRIRELLERRD